MTDSIKKCTGGCACGQVRYEVTATPMIVHACHCRWCQRQTGGPHVINALFEAEHVLQTRGDIEKIDTPSPSGKGQVIARCPDCKVAVWSSYDFRGLRERVRFLRVGTLDEPDRMPPDVHIYTSTKMPWYRIPAEHYAVEAFYDLATTWSPENRKRYQALVDALEAAPG